MWVMPTCLHMHMVLHAASAYVHVQCTYTCVTIAKGLWSMCCVHACLYMYIYMYMLGVLLMKSLPHSSSWSLLARHCAQWQCGSKGPFFVVNSAPTSLHMHMVMSFRCNSISQPITWQGTRGSRHHGFQLIVHCLANARINFHAPSMLLECHEDWWHVGSCSSVVRAPAAKVWHPGFDSQWLPWFFSLSAGLLILMGWRICGALV